MSRTIKIPILGIETQIDDSGTIDDVIKDTVEAVSEASILFCISANTRGEGIVKELSYVQQDLAESTIDLVYELFKNAKNAVITLVDINLKNEDRITKWYKNINSREEFIELIKNDAEFAETMNLQITERKLEWEELTKWVMKHTDVEWENLYIVEEIAKDTTPKTVVTVKRYHDTIEYYL